MTQPPEYREAEAYPTQASPAQDAAKTPSTEPRALTPEETLAKMVGNLRAAYPRAAHAGRLEQIEQLTTTLGHLVSLLPGEEAREADYESRLLDSYDKAQFGTDPHTASHEARMRLAEALEARKAAQA